MHRLEVEKINIDKLREEYYIYKWEKVYRLRAIVQTIGNIN